MERYIEMSDGHFLFTRTLKPSKPCIGHIHILHGMAEHSGRYVEFANSLNEAGYAVTMHDHRGHGETAAYNGTLGFFAEQNGFDRVVEDAHEVVTLLHEQFADVPFILFGHSMGSFITRRYIQLYSDQVDHVILCGTGNVTALHTMGNLVAKVLAKQLGKDTESKLLNKLSFGSFNKQFPNSKTAYDWICSVEDEVEKYIDDPYCGFIPTNQFFVDLTTGFMSLNRKSEIAKVKKDLPILLISGSKDPVGEQGQGVYAVAEQFAEAGIQDVTVYLFEDKRHEILNEDNREAVYQVLLRWLEKYDTR
ncbi:lysophospholipase [Lysinibacillus xylanilyticus]|uniref:alpha/beta fold hydrolase n=1 Tax=Lysinibacillus xylanilyticus TaxID=582475 RepID=UPI002B2404E4|nr:alpha/beta fold hydrolase [Lysinibacillus xylanilyticus]MEB2302459.1 lysophospholipase [Lysinibacillus xylanilyticus]